MCKTKSVFFEMGSMNNEDVREINGIQIRYYIIHCFIVFVSRQCFNSEKIALALLNLNAILLIC